MSDAYICTTPMCSAGEASIVQMTDTFSDLSDNPAFDQERFRATMDSIQAAFDAVWNWYDPYIPFNSDCCTIQDIGKSADTLTNSMLGSVGASPVTGPSSGATAGSDLLLVAAILFGGYLILREVRVGKWR